ncbi:hypothetical protein [Prosthecobacter sp.]|uniref:hypothetical protein n=1 Tax=Prosthecobacter sp. TaxID=1965333 RepID=UPI003783D414
MLISTPGGESKQVHKGDSIRSGTVIECGADAGASLKPLPTLHIIVYPDTKVRFDGSDVNGDGGGSVMFTIIAGKALFHIDQPPPANGDSKPAVPVIKVTVVTDEGIIVNNVGGKQEQGDAGKPDDKTSPRQIVAATWTVQHDEGRTIVAVSEGLSNVSIGKGAAAGSGEVGGQVKVPQGSVIWLFNRDGKIAAELVDTNTGKVTNLTGGPSSGNSLVEQSKNQLVNPSSGGSTSTPGSTPNSPGTLPNNPSSNPDLSTPQKPLPVVSADTP